MSDVYVSACLTLPIHNNLSFMAFQGRRKEAETLEEIEYEIKVCILSLEEPYLIVEKNQP